MEHIQAPSFDTLPGKWQSRIHSQLKSYSDCEEVAELLTVPDQCVLDHLT